MLPCAMLTTTSPHSSRQNTELLETTLLDVSDPDSMHYGKHLSNAEVNAMVHPKQASIDAVYVLPTMLVARQGCAGSVPCLN